MTEPAPPRAALIFAVLSLTAVVLLAGLYLWDRQNERREQNHAMLDQLQRIDARLSKIETTVAEQGDAMQKLSDASSAMAQNATTIAAQSVELHATLEHLQQATASTSQAQQISAFAQLKSAVNSGHAFSAELAQIHGADTSALAPLAGGVTTPEQLEQELSTIAPALMHGKTKKDWWHQILARLSGFITPRPLPSANADITTPSGKISRGLYDLEQHDVQGALDVLPKPAPSSDPGEDVHLVDFRNHAENYLATQKSLINLQSTLSAPPPAPPINPQTVTLMPPAGTSK